MSKLVSNVGLHVTPSVSPLLSEAMSDPHVTRAVGFLLSVVWSIWVGHDSIVGFSLSVMTMGNVNCDYCDLSLIPSPDHGSGDFLL